MKKIAFVLGFALIQFFSIAQEHVFNVIALSGNAKLSNGTALKSGDQILSDQTIVVEKNGYVALMHKTGKTVEVKTSGNFLATDLAKKINQGADNYASQYSDFVVKQMSGDAASNSYSNTGSVTRDIMKNIEVLLPKKVSLLKNTPFHFSWVSPKKGDTYTVKIVDLFDQVLYEKSVTTNELNLDISKIDKLKGGKMSYLLQVCSNQKKNLVSKKIKLFIKTSSEEQKISNEYTNLASELGASNAINSLIIASFYESKGLTAYAANNLEQATHQAPKVAHYQKIYVNYLYKKDVNIAYLKIKD